MSIVPAPPMLHWRTAFKAIEAAIGHAESLGVRVNAAMCDAGGNLIAFLRMPAAPLHSITIAEDKAYTAAGFGIATGAWAALLGGDEHLRAGLMLRPRLVMLGGGLPLLRDGQCLGGIGVSGGSEAQDVLCASAGLAAIGFETPHPSPG